MKKNKQRQKQVSQPAHRSASVQRSRRHLLLAGLGIAGAMVVGWSVLPPRQRLHTAAPPGLSETSVALNGWVVVSMNGRVSIMLAKSEMGQGVTTSLAMLVAEELDVPLSAVEMVQAPLDKIYGDTTMVPDGLPFRPDDQGLLARSAHWMTRKLMREVGLVVTGGSSSVKDSWLPMREAGAAARARLIAAAAQLWGTDRAACRTEAGRVWHVDGRSLGYGELAQRAATLGEVPYTLKSQRDFRLIGHAAQRIDGPSKINGSARFGLDVRLPGMVYATVAMCPVFGGKLQSFDPESLAGLAGVVRLLPLSSDRAGAPDAVAIVATSRWASLQALAALKVEWQAGPHAPWSSDLGQAALRQALDDSEGFSFYKRGDLAQFPEVSQSSGSRQNSAVQAGTSQNGTSQNGTSQSGTKHVVAQYSVPHLAHAALEPVNCTAQYKQGRLTLWVPTQSPSTAVAAGARAANVDTASVDLHVTQLGGGFGRRLDSDMVVQAAAIAHALDGAPVQLMWTREQDIRHDFYRPAAVAMLSASLDATGKVIALTSKSASGAPAQQLMHRAFGLPMAGPDKTTVEGLFDHPYEISNQRIAHVTVDSPVPLGPWRSVGHSHNAFFKECFIDELAAAVNADPVAFRRRLLSGRPRHLAVLDAAVRLAGSPAAGRAFGVALHESFGSIVAQVAEVSVEAGRIRVHRISCAVDCGIVVHPDGVRQQVESAVCMGLSAALLERITMRQGRVSQSNYTDYRLLRIGQMPEVAIVILPSNAPPEGMGEPATPPVAPAVANAVFQLTGQRLRSLPLTLA